MVHLCSHPEGQHKIADKFEIEECVVVAGPVDGCYLVCLLQATKRGRAKCSKRVHHCNMYDTQLSAEQYLAQSGLHSPVLQLKQDSFPPLTPVTPPTPCPLSGQHITRAMDKALQARHAEKQAAHVELTLVLMANIIDSRNLVKIDVPKSQLHLATQALTDPGVVSTVDCGSHPVRVLKLSDST